MRGKLVATNTLVLMVCAACAKPIPTTVAVHTALPTKTVSPPTSIVETPIPDTQRVRPGVYVANEANALPLPTSGYDLFVVGEPHGEREVRLLTLDYLKILYETAGVRDIILEQISPVYERDVSAYVFGLDDVVSSDWAFLADIIIGVRMFNDALPDSEKIRVHLVDLDLGLANIHAHLQVLQEQIGARVPNIEVPPLSQFRGWDEAKALALVDQMADVAGDDRVITGELATVRDSVRNHFAWKQLERGRIEESEFIEHLSIREERIAQNIQHLLAKLGGTPALALYGGSHAQKRPAMIVTLAFFSQPVFVDVPFWAQRLAESKISIYSVLAMGLSGREGVEGEYSLPVERDPHQMLFSDGITLADVLDAIPQYSIIYVDLRLDANSAFRLGNSFQDVPAGEVYDGIILFREVSPVAWEKYP